MFLDLYEAIWRKALADESHHCRNYLRYNLKACLKDDKRVNKAMKRINKVLMAQVQENVYNEAQMWPRNIKQSYSYVNILNLARREDERQTKSRIKSTHRL